MSHYHVEIIMPPTDNVVAAVAEVLEPFNENGEDASHAFWDFYVIGGRFAGSKLMAKFDESRVEAFYDELRRRKVTVNGFVCGKQSIEPASQIPMVDALWNEMFPGHDGPCPLFKHSNDQYKNDSLIDGDIAPLASVPDRLTCSRVIIAAPAHNKPALKAVDMVARSYWNGVRWQDTGWDGLVQKAVKDFTKDAAWYGDPYRTRVTPQAHWIAVTVDCHS